MKLNIKITRLFILLIISLLISIAGSYFYNKYSKDRYLNSMKISTLYSNESVTLQSIRMRIGFNPMELAATNFAQKLNDGIYNSLNPCGKINRINNIMPVIISNSKNDISVEIATSDKIIMDNCKKFIKSEVERENRRIVTFYKSLLSMNPKRIENDLRRDVDIEKFITFYNKVKKRLVSSINISDKEIDPYLSKWIMQLIPPSDSEVISLDLVEKIEYFKLISDRTSIQKSIDLKIYFIGLFILSFLITIMLNKASKKKTIKMFSNIDKFLS